MKDTLFVTDAEMAQRLGIQTKDLEVILPALTKAGLPAPDPAVKNRRYWPAVRAFLDKRYGMASSSGAGIPALDGEERWTNN